MNNELLENKIRNRLSEMEIWLKEAQNWNVDTMSEEQFTSISEIEFCIFEFKSLLGIEAEREQTYIWQQVE
jgi:hypothetical protein